jgi:hypothetical protein
MPLKFISIICDFFSLDFYFFSFQMCLHIEMMEKAQTCDDFLPEGWLFFFESERKNPDYDGLFLINSSNMTPKRLFRYRSFEAAATTFQSSFKNLDAGKFYNEVGLSQIGNARGSSLPPKTMLPRTTASDGCLTPQQLQEKRCRVQLCGNCRRQVCGKCDSCLANSCLAGKGGCCLRRVSF